MCVCVCVCACACVCACVHACVCVHVSMGTFFFLLLSWMFQHDCLDTCCFGCLIYMYFVLLYLHLFSATEHVSHGKAL